MIAKHIAEAIADSIITVGIRDSADEMADEAVNLLTQPLDLFLGHPNWPSAVTSEGVPFELSMSINSDGASAIRYLIDVTDHRLGLSGNWNRYLNYARQILEISSDQDLFIWKLFAKHLDGIPATWRTRLGHGVGYGHNGLRRGTLYFSTGKFTYNEIENRFPDYISAINETIKKYGGYYPSGLNNIAYDFANGKISKTKMYWFIKQSDKYTCLSDIAGEHPDLAIASNIFGHFLNSKPTLSKAHSSLLLQLSFDRLPNHPHEKIYFNCMDWGWDQPEAFQNLTTYLLDTFSMDLSPMYALLQIFAEYKIRLKPTWLSVSSGSPYPYVGFYFCPMVEELYFSLKQKKQTILTETTLGDENNPVSVNPVGSQIELIDKMYKRAVAYILAARSNDGHWEDFALPQGTSDEWVTAYITATLAMDSNLRSHLEHSAEWLQDRFQPTEGWGYSRKVYTDADSTALGILSLHRLGLPLPDGTRDALLRFRLPGGGYRAYMNWDIDDEHGFGATEVTAIALLAQIEAGLVKPDMICETVANLMPQQRDEGGWNVFWWKDDLFATNRVLLALNAFVRFASRYKGDEQLSIDIVNLATQAIENTRSSISAKAVPSQPFVLGLWLSSWFGANGKVSYPSVKRILYHLRSQQQRDGHFLSVPVKRIARTKLLRPWARSDSGKLYLDQQCLVTTTTVIEGLFELRQAIGTVSDSYSC